MASRTRGFCDDWRRWECKAKRLCNAVIDGHADAYLTVLDIRAALDGGDA